MINHVIGKGRSLKAAMENRLCGMALAKDAGLNGVVIEAGLIIVGVFCLVIFATKGEGAITQIVDACTTKALAIFK